MEYVLIVSIFIIAFLYSSVGHGGASGYLAIMALFSIIPVIMRPSALMLNIFVSVIAFYNYYKAGYFKVKLIVPFLITSIPMAFIGASIPVHASVYKIVLGIFLLLATVRMLFVPGAILETSQNPALWISLIIGAILGFFSGMIGIGGGIILSPLLILFHWANLKESAAASALFIFLNSLSGLTALFLNGLIVDKQIIFWIVSGILGGILGSYLGSKKIPSEKLKYILAMVLFFASIKLFLF